MSVKSKKISVYQVTLNPASVGAATTAEQSFDNVPGLITQEGDRVYVNKPTHTPGLGIVNARAGSPIANSVRIAFCNPTAAPIDPPSELYTIVVIGA